MSNVLTFLLAMVAVFLIFNVMVSTALEAWNGWRAKRGTFLWKGVESIVGPTAHGKEIIRELQLHPAIRALRRPEDHRPPSYIPSQTFAEALIDVVLERNAGVRLVKYGLAEAIAMLPAELPIKRTLELAWNASAGDRALFTQRLARLFDDCMERVTGWYKRDAQVRSVVLGLILAALLDFDAVHIAVSFWRDPSIAQVVADQGAALGAQLGAPGPDTRGAVAGRREVTIRASDGSLILPQQLPLGWPPRWYAEIPSDAKEKTREVAFHLAAMALGILIMGASCVLGAPMWFQILASLMPLRAAGKVPAQMPPTLPQDGTLAASPRPIATPGIPAPPGPATGAAPWLNELEHELVEERRVPELQKALAVPETGIFDRATRDAIREFQRRQRYAPTGQVTRLLLQDLRTSGSSRAREAEQ